MGSKGILLVYNNHGDHRPIFIKTGSGRYSQLPVKGRNHQIYRKRRIYFQDNPVKGHNLTEKREGRILGNTEAGGEYVEKGEPIARILDTYSAHVLSEITSPVDGTIGFSFPSPLIYENTTIFKIIKDEDI